MARIHRVLGPLLALALLYAIAWLYVDDLPYLDDRQARSVLLLLPVLAVAGLGAYCVAELAWGVVTMGTAEGAFLELQQDIAAAKKDLQSKGIHVD